jgi:hypothetical protein
MKVGPSSGNSAESTASITALLAGGKPGAAGVLETAGCRKTYR